MNLRVMLSDDSFFTSYCFSNFISHLRGILMAYYVMSYRTLPRGRPGRGQSLLRRLPKKPRLRKRQLALPRSARKWLKRELQLLLEQALEQALEMA